MVKERQERLIILAKKERFRRDLPQLRLNVASILGLRAGALESLPFEVSDKLGALVSAHVSTSLKEQNLKRLRFGLQAQSEFELAFERGLASLKGKVLLWSRGYPLLLADSGVLQSKFFPLWHLLDTVVISSESGTKGLVADSYPEGWDPGFEFAQWDQEVQT